LGLPIVAIDAPFDCRHGAKKSGAKSGFVGERSGRSQHHDQRADRGRRMVAAAHPMQVRCCAVPARKESSPRQIGQRGSHGRNQVPGGDDDHALGGQIGRMRRTTRRQQFTVVAGEGRSCLGRS